MIGNKADLDSREVMVEEAEQVAEEYGMAHFVTSAKAGIMIE